MMYEHAIFRNRSCVRKLIDEICAHSKVLEPIPAAQAANKSNSMGTLPSTWIIRWRKPGFDNRIFSPVRLVGAPYCIGFAIDRAIKSETPWCFCDKGENISAGHAVSGRGPTVQMTACPKKPGPETLNQWQGRVRDQIV